MKITLKISKRIRFYTMMIACCAFLWMMVRNNWINLETLGGFAFLVVIIIAIMILAAAAVAWLIRKILNTLQQSTNKQSMNKSTAQTTHKNDADNSQ